MSLMNANKTNIHKHVANICLSIHNVHRAQHTHLYCTGLTSLSSMFYFILLRGYIAPPGGFMAHRCTGLMVVHCISVTHLLV